MPRARARAPNDPHAPPFWVRARPLASIPPKPLGRPRDSRPVVARVSLGHRALAWAAEREQLSKKAGLEALQKSEHGEEEPPVLLPAA